MCFTLKANISPVPIHINSVNFQAYHLFGYRNISSSETGKWEKLDKKITKLVFNFKESIDPQETLDPVLKYKLQDRKGNDKSMGYFRK